MTSNNYVNFGRKNKERDRKNFKYAIILIIAIFLILLGGAFYAVAYSPLFHIKQINSDADTALYGFNIVDKLKDFFANRSEITKFLGPNNILVWDESGLDRFLKVPEIAEISLKKDYFKRTINISVKLRERFGVWCVQAQNNADLTQNNAEKLQISTEEIQRDSVSDLRGSAAQCAWFDQNGVLFAMAPQLEGNAINRVEDFSGRNLKAGDLVLSENLVPNLVKIFGVLEKSGLGIRALKLENFKDMEIAFDQPETSLPKIYFSLKDDPEFALPVIENLKNAGLNKIEYIDFRVENRGYYKLK